MMWVVLPAVHGENTLIDISKLLEKLLPYLSPLFQQYPIDASESEKNISKKHTTARQKKTTTKSIKIEVNTSYQLNSSFTESDCCSDSERDSAEMESTVANKISELKPILEEKSEPVTGNAIRTLIEFHSKKNNLRSPNKTAPNPRTLIEKYETLRQKIKKLLHEKAGSEKHQQFIAKVFDDLVKELFKAQCAKKSLQKGWGKEWRRLRDQYFKKLDKEQKVFITSEDLSSIFEYFNKFISDIVSFVDQMSESYIMTCKPVGKTTKINSTTTPSKIKKSELRSPAQCKQIKICAKELNDFFLDFYNLLKKISTNSIESYKQMFYRDATIANIESVMKVLDMLEKKVGPKVTAGFTKKIQHFKLIGKDEKKQYIIIHDFIETTIHNIYKKVRALIEEEMRTLHGELQTRVLDDMFVYVDKELTEFKVDAISNICKLFENCNGKAPMTRKFMDQNSSYVVKIDFEGISKDNKWIDGFQPGIPQRRAMQSVNYNTKLLNDFRRTQIIRFQKVSKNPYT